MATKWKAVVSDLLGDDEQKRLVALHGLRDDVVGDGSWDAQAGPIVEALLAGLKKAAEPRLVLVLVADVVGADHMRAWLQGPGSCDSKVQSALTQHRGDLVDLLGSDDATVRAAATVPLAMDASADALKALLEHVGDDDEVVRASALLAVAGFEDEAGHAALSGALDDDSALVAGAAAVARLRQDPSFGFADAADALRGWLAYQPVDEPRALPWFRSWRSHPWFRGLWFVDSTPRALVRIARHRGDAAVEALTDFAFQLADGLEDGAVETQLAKIALELGGFTPAPGTAPPDIDVVESLTEQQRAMAERLAGSWLLPKGEFQLPAAGATRRRWAGLSPPASLETIVEVEGEPMPAFKALSTLGWPALDLLEPVDRWQALVEYTAKSYPPKKPSMAPAFVDQELERAAKIEGLQARVAEVADDLAARFAAAERTNNPIPPSFPMSTLLLLPSARMGGTVEERWERLIYVGKEPQARELLTKLPKGQRQRVVASRLKSADNALAALKSGLAVADLATTPEVGALLRDRLAEVESRGGVPPRSLAKLRDGLATLVKEHPELAS